MLLIMFFILLLNVVAIGLIYYCLNDLDKKGKVIFIATGIAIVYVLTSFVYWISTKNVAIQEVSKMGKDIITFLFVPINSIIILPILAKSYNKYKLGMLAGDKLRNRGILLAILLFILLTIECFYFQNIQNSVIELVKEDDQNYIQLIEEYYNNGVYNFESSNEIVNSVETNSIDDETSNSMQNVISNNIVEENIVNETE